MGCIRFVTGLFGLVIIFTILRLISPVLAWMFAIGVPVLILRSAYDQHQARLKAAKAQQELRERMRREAEQRAEARRRAREEEIRREADIFAEQLRKGVEAAAAAQAAEARRRQASTRAHEQKDASAEHPRWGSTDPHVILDIPPGADATTVRNAYTTLVSQYHPDKVARLAPEFRQLADERMKAINAAYSRLRSDR